MHNEDINLNNSLARKNNAALIFENNQIYWGQGFGMQGYTTGELVFNTSIVGYQELISDPSYAGQIIVMSFPHIGNVGTTKNDMESSKPYLSGCIIRNSITNPSNWRSQQSFDKWLQDNEIICISGIDTRKIITEIRNKNLSKGLIVHSNNEINELTYRNILTNSTNQYGFELTKLVSCKKNILRPTNQTSLAAVALIDYGNKNGITNNLNNNNLDVTIVPPTATAQEILSLNIDGIVLSNGPGDPWLISNQVEDTIKQLTESNKPILGICMGHQILAISHGAKTYKMHHGHRGINHPIKDIVNNKVIITSQNHGFAIDAKSLTDNLEVTHISLFDNCIEGIKVKDKPIYSVQFHPEANPGPNDASDIIKNFANLVIKSKNNA